MGSNKFLYGAPNIGDEGVSFVAQQPGDLAV